MWPKCLDALKPFARPLQAEPPEDLVAAFQQLGWPDPQTALPVRMVALLGTCPTDQNRECPNLPAWHIENAREAGDEESYLRKVGRYFWCDFDLWDRNGPAMKLRMAFNEGDADCNDGTWGQVWERDTAEVVANLSSVGDGEGRVETVPSPRLQAYQPHPWPVPTDRERFGNCRPPFQLIPAHDREVERLIAIAIAWCCAYR